MGLPPLHHARVSPAGRTPREVCGERTVVLLGASRVDTPRAFFTALSRAGFAYHLLSHEGDFGLIRVFRRQSFFS